MCHTSFNASKNLITMPLVTDCSIATTNIEYCSFAGQVNIKEEMHAQKHTPGRRDAPGWLMRLSSSGE